MLGDITEYFPLASYADTLLESLPLRVWGKEYHKFKVSPRNLARRYLQIKNNNN